jgi:hypothetical protein
LHHLLKENNEDGEQNGLNKTAAPDKSENSQPCDLFLL